jgi:response regulator RpfG family c-di-GMP phosphodiesterase
MEFMHKTDLSEQDKTRNTTPISPNKRDFLSYTSHGLRNCIMGIIGYSEMLIENAESKEFEEYLVDLKKVLMSGRELLNLVNDMFNPSKINIQTSSDVHDFTVKLQNETLTPLSVIKGYTEILLDEMEQKQEISMIPDLKMILVATERFLSSVNNLKSLWRDDSVKIQQEVMNHDNKRISEYLTSSIHMLSEENLAKKRDICGNVLIVDDSEQNRDLLCRKLERDSKTVYVAASGQEAIEILRSRVFDVVLLDIMMPGMNGYDVLRYLKFDAALCNIPVIMLSGLDEIDHVVQCIEMGAEDYLQKPFDTVLLKARIGACLERKRLRDIEQAYLEQLRFERIKKALGETVQAMAMALETRDPYTAGHQRRVSDLGRAIAMEMSLSSDTMECIHIAGIVHDLGKIAVPAEILSKPTRLTEIEIFLLQTHARAGYDILKKIEFPWPIAQIVLQHHERLDGSGYPERISGEAILLEARILTVADVVEAITSHRPYRPGFGIDQALKEMTLNRGILYDSEVVDACIRLFRIKGYEIDIRLTDDEIG